MQAWTWIAIAVAIVGLVGKTSGDRPLISPAPAMENRRLEASMAPTHSSSDGQSASPTLEEMPRGQYYYVKASTTSTEPTVDAQTTSDSPYLLLWKSGATVIGVDGRSRLQTPCFRGFLQGNQIVNATRIFPPYDPAAAWEAHHGDYLDLSQYQAIDREPTEVQQQTLETCLQVFAR